MATDLPHLLLSVLPFARASMVSPLTIIIVMAVLSATKRRALKAVFFAITYATVFSGHPIHHEVVESFKCNNEPVRVRERTTQRASIDTMAT